MGAEHDDQAGTPVLFRPLFVELSEDRIAKLRGVFLFEYDPIDLKIVDPLRQLMWKHGIAQLRAMRLRADAEWLAQMRETEPISREQRSRLTRMLKPTTSESATTLVMRKRPASAG